MPRVKDPAGIGWWDTPLDHPVYGTAEERRQARQERKDTQKVRDKYVNAYRALQRAASRANGW